MEEHESSSDSDIVVNPDEIYISMRKLMKQRRILENRSMKRKIIIKRRLHLSDTMPIYEPELVTKPIPREYPNIPFWDNRVIIDTSPSKIEARLQSRVIDTNYDSFPQLGPPIHFMTSSDDNEELHDKKSACRIRKAKKHAVHKKIQQNKQPNLQVHRVQDINIGIEDKVIDKPHSRKHKKHHKSIQTSENHVSSKDLIQESIEHISQSRKKEIIDYINIVNQNAPELSVSFDSIHDPILPIDDINKNQKININDVNRKDPEPGDDPLVQEMSSDVNIQINKEYDPILDSISSSNDGLFTLPHMLDDPLITAEIPSTKKKRKARKDPNDWKILSFSSESSFGE